MAEIDAAEVAAWLAERPDIFWSIDGEEDLAAELSFPCTAADLAAALRTHGGRVSLDPPPGSSVGDRLTRANFETAAVLDDGARVFRLAWVDATGAGEPWLLVEDTLARAASA